MAMESRESQNRIGRRVATLRKIRGLTQAQLAARCSYSIDTVKKTEQGSIPASTAFVGHAARALGADPSYFYGIDDRALAEESSATQLANLRVAVDAWDDPRPEGQRLSLATINRRLDVIAKAVSDRQWLPERPVRVTVERTALTLNPSFCAATHA